MRGQIFWYEELRLKAQDDKIIDLIEDAYVFEKAGSCSVKQVILVALCCGRITLADLPIPVGCV